jgi:hypothetical protein
MRRKRVGALQIIEHNRQRARITIAVPAGTVFRALDFSETIRSLDRST